MMWRLARLLVATLVLTAPAPAQGSAPEPDGYRTDNYRAPVPANALGRARTLHRRSRGDLARR